MASAQLTGQIIVTQCIGKLADSFTLCHSAQWSQKAVKLLQKQNGITEEELDKKTAAIENNDEAEKDLLWP